MEGTQAGCVARAVNRTFPSRKRMVGHWRHYNWSQLFERQSMYVAISHM